MRRQVDEVLDAWAADDGRRPLLIRGARQVGQDLLGRGPCRADVRRLRIDQSDDGAVAEQFVGQELLAHRSPFERPELFYWHRRQKSSSAEVDYLVAARGRVVPVEVKAGKTGRLRSLAVFAEHYRPPVAVRVYADRLRRDGAILSAPLYGLEGLDSILRRFARDAE